MIQISKATTSAIRITEVHIPALKISPTSSQEENPARNKNSKE
jgi:hypothetical protein